MANSTNRAKEQIQRLPPIDVHEMIEELYGSTSWSINSYESYEMDQALKGLQNPAHQSFFVIQHALRTTRAHSYGSTGEELSHVKIALIHCLHLLKPSYHFLVNNNHDRSTENNQFFVPGDLFHIQPDDSVSEPQQGWEMLSTRTYHLTASMIPSKAIARTIIISAAKSCKKHFPCQSGTETDSTQHTNDHVESLLRHLYITLGTDLRNGAAAEVAFDLSLAGCRADPGGTTNHLYDILAHISAMELERKSIRSSRRALDILQVVEKLAASGIRGPYAARANSVAASSLVGSRGSSSIPQETLEELQSGKLWLLSHRSLLWLWRRMSTFHKVTPQELLSLADSWEQLQHLKYETLFSNPSLPLVVDFGCGLGVSLLGLANQQECRTYRLGESLFDWKRCNFLGGEASSNAERWGNTLAERWETTNQLQLLHISTENLLEYFAGCKQVPLKLILLQFPTPYKLQEQGDTPSTSRDGNCHLPASSTDESFMANPCTLQKMVDLLTRSSQLMGGTTCYLLVQSNCEDIALYIYDTLTSMGLQAVNSKAPRTLEQATQDDQISTRTKSWLAEQRKSSSEVRRAVGDHWSSIPYLPVATETEASCLWHGTPVHRCLFRTPMEIPNK